MTDRDVTDWWQELTDPKNEFGEVCTATYVVDPYPVLSTITVEDMDDKTVWDRYRIAEVFGMAAIWHLERLEVWKWS